MEKRWTFDCIVTRPFPNILYVYAGGTPRDKEKQKGWGAFELGRLQENGVHFQCTYIYIYIYIYI
jgi:hypothetical protein